MHGILIPCRPVTARRRQDADCPIHDGTETLRMTNPENQPLDLVVQRERGLLRIKWADGHASAYSLLWLRSQCPCATCREERRERLMEEASGSFRLNSGPQPSAEVVAAELVGAYALRPEWGDGHNTGIYPFSSLRRSCPCAECNPGGAPPLVPD